MRSWVLLLLLAALLAARLRIGGAEGDPLPPSLVDLVRNSPISSVEDLKLLLQRETNTIGEEEDEDEARDVLANRTHARYARSPVEAQPAQQAACKVRTEVMEVTRSMLDRRNANFLLWPPCVEVQRCSGCCNTRLLQCVPTLTSSRYLQVIKIQYVNKKAHYDKAVISVEDHVSCRCQTSSSSSSSSSTPAAIPRAADPPPPPPQLPPASPHLPRNLHPAPGRTQTSKADLHRHDDLKHNQHHYPPEERAAAPKQWQQGSYTQLVHWTQPRAHQPPPPHVQPAVRQGVAALPGPSDDRPSEARAEHSFMGSAPPVGHGSGYDGSREETHALNGDDAARHSDHARRHQQHQYRHLPLRPQYGGGDPDMRTQHRLDAPQSDAASPPSAPTQPPTPTAIQKDSATGGGCTEVTAHKQTEAETVSQKEGGEESGSAHSGDAAGGEPGRDSKAPSEDARLAEEERRQKLLEVVQREPDLQARLHPRHPQQRPKPTTFKTAFSTAAPAPPLARQTPPRPASTRRRRRHRKRISKAAMRAMIM